MAGRLNRKHRELAPAQRARNKRPGSVARLQNGLFKTAANLPCVVSHRGSSIMVCLADGGTIIVVGWVGGGGAA